MNLQVLTVVLSLGVALASVSGSCAPLPMTSIGLVAH